MGKKTLHTSEMNDAGDDFKAMYESKRAVDLSVYVLANQRRDVIGGSDQQRVRESLALAC